MQDIWQFQAQRAQQRLNQSKGRLNEITARVFENNKLLGYEMRENTGQYLQCSKRTIWELAKKKQIKDVMASGSENNMILSGTNGFKLGDLPRVPRRSNLR